MAGPGLLAERGISVNIWFLSAFMAALVGVAPFHPALAQSAPDLGTAGNFAVLAGPTVACTGAVIDGDVGVDLGGSVGACTVMGDIYAGDSIAVKAYNDFLVAYAALSPQPGDVYTVQNGTLAGLTLAPGVYWLDDSVKTGLLTLDGLGDPDAVWIFKSGTSSLMGAGFNVVMAGGGNPCANGARVFWWSAQAAALTDSNFIGTVLAGTDITVINGNFIGQTLATGAITLTTPGSFIFCGNVTDCTPPGVFGLLSPLNHADDMPVSGVTLDWNDSAGAKTYRLYFGTVNPPPLYHVGLMASRYDLPVLNPNTWYFWSATATNGCLPDYFPEAWSFFTGTACIPPEAPHLQSPPCGAAGVPESVTLSWYAAANAVFYEVWLGLDPGHLVLLGTTTELSWAVADLLEGTEYCWLITAVNDCGTAHSETCCFTLAGAPEPVETLLYIPGVAAMPGDHASWWKTDVQLMTTSDRDAAYSITFIPADTDGTQSPHVISGTLGAGRVERYQNIVHDAFGLSESFGFLRIVSDQLLIAVARTYHDTDDGTYGQGILGYRVDPVLGLSDIRHLVRRGEVGYLIHPIFGTAYRSNVGFMEVTGKAVDVEVTLFSHLDEPLGTKVYPLFPLGFQQVSGIFEDMGVEGDHLAARAEVCITGEGTVLAYASITDNTTNDSIFTVGEKFLETFSETQRTLAAAAHTHGANNSFWRSDVRVLNPHAGNANITYTYRPADGAAITRTLAVPAMNILYTNDVLSQIFGIIGDTDGSLDVESDSPLMLSSRIYTDAHVGGTYGQQILSYRPDQGIVNHHKGIVLGLRDNGNYRTNLGMTEIAGGTLTVLVQLYDTTGVVIAERSVNLAPYPPMQWNNVFLQWDLSGTFEAYAVVRGVAGGGRVAAYASVVVNPKNDAVYIPAQ
jgi:hypothetical protein